MRVFLFGTNAFWVYGPVFVLNFKEWSLGFCKRTFTSLSQCKSVIKCTDSKAAQLVTGLIFRLDELIFKDRDSFSVF